MTESPQLREYREKCARQEAQFAEALHKRVEGSKSGTTGLRRSFLLYEFWAKIFGYAPWIIGALAVAAMLPLLNAFPIATFLVLVLFICLRPLDRILGRIRKRHTGWHYGLAVSETDLPELHAMVHEVSERLGVKPAPAILITDKSDVLTQVRPRNKGGYRINELVIGVPSLLSLGPEELRAILAVTIADLKTGGSDIFRRAQRLDDQIAMLLPHLQGTTSGWHRLLLPLVLWYRTNLRPVSAALTRGLVYEADLVALQAVSKTTLANALLRTSITEIALKHGYFADRNQKVERNEWSSHDAFLKLLTAADETRSADLGEARLRFVATARAATTDTHPRMADRMDALGITLETAEADYKERFTSNIPPAQTPDRFTQFCQGYFLKYQAKSYEEWAEKSRKRFEKSQERLATLRFQRPENPSPGWCEYYASTFWAVEGLESAREQLEPLLARFPEYGPLNAMYAACNLLLMDERGIAYAESGIGLDWSTAPWLLPYLRSYYENQGDRDAFDQVVLLLRESQIREAFVAQAMQSVSKDDGLEALDAGDPRLAVLRESAMEIRHVHQLYCVKKTTSTTRELPKIVVVALVEISSEHDFTRSQSLEWLNSKLHLPWRSILVVPTMQGPWRTQLDKVPGALIFERPNKGYL